MDSARGVAHGIPWLCAGQAESQAVADALLAFAWFSRAVILANYAIFEHSVAHVKVDTWMLRNTHSIKSAASYKA